MLLLLLLVSLLIDFLAGKAVAAPVPVPVPVPTQEKEEEVVVVHNSGFVYWLWGQTSSDKIRTREAIYGSSSK
ncbi:hypothetical protein ACJW31_09G130200 [Castanea mollissima]